jgi:hypothetical protein
VPEQRHGLEELHSTTARIAAEALSFLGESTNVAFARRACEIGAIVKRAEQPSVEVAEKKPQEPAQVSSDDGGHDEDAETNADYRTVRPQSAELVVAQPAAEPPSLATDLVAIDSVESRTTAELAPNAKHSMELPLVSSASHGIGNIATSNSTGSTGERAPTPNVLVSGAVECYSAQLAAAARESRTIRRPPGMQANPALQMPSRPSRPMTQQQVILTSDVERSLAEHDSRQLQSVMPEQPALVSQPTADRSQEIATAKPVEVRPVVQSAATAPSLEVLPVSEIERRPTMRVPPRAARPGVPPPAQSPRRAPAQPTAHGPALPPSAAANTAPQVPAPAPRASRVPPVPGAEQVAPQGKPERGYFAVGPTMMQQMQRQLVLANERAKASEARSAEAERRAQWAEQVAGEAKRISLRAHPKKRDVWLGHLAKGLVSGLVVCVVCFSLGGYISLLIPVRQRVISQDAALKGLADMRQRLEQRNSELAQQLRELDTAKPTPEPEPQAAPADSQRAHGRSAH